MDKKEIIATTMANMQSIYKDISKFIRIVEEGMENHGFKALGDRACTWESSSSYNYPNSWLYKYFARVYMNVSNLKRAVGFSLHLGGYKDIDLRKLMKYSLSLPFINVSILEQKEEFKTVSKQENRMEIYNWLWGAGWWEGGPEVKKTIKNGLVKEIFKDGANISFFVDFLYLTKEELIENLVVDPMLKMFAGNEDWVIKNKLPVWPITTDIGE